MAYASMDAFYEEPAVRLFVDSKQIEEHEARFYSRVNTVMTEANKLLIDSISRDSTLPHSTDLVVLYPQASFLSGEVSSQDAVDFIPLPTRPGLRDRNKAIAAAEDYCAAVTQLSGIEKNEIFNHVNSLFSKFLESIAIVTVPGRPPYSLLLEEGMTYSELDFIQATKHIESPRDRAVFWTRIAKVYKHLYGPHADVAQSPVEEKQLATLFFNSLYVSLDEAREFIQAIGHRMTANPEKNNAFRYVIALLSNIGHSDSQADAARVLTSRIRYLPFSERRNATMLFRMFLPGDIHPNKAKVIAKLSKTWYLQSAYTDLDLLDELSNDLNSVN